MKYFVAISILSYLFGSIRSSPILNTSISTRQSNRIYGGELSEPNRYPFTVVTLIIPSFSLCGGVILSNKYVLTSAQYIYDLDNILSIFIYIGAHQFNDPDEDGRQDDFIDGDDLPNYVIIHEKFNPDTLENNIALIKLVNPLEFSDTVQSIRLPPPTLTASSLVDKTATLMGWGYSEDNPNEFEVHPKHVNVTIVHQAVCNHYYATGNKALCTDGEFREGACQGDVGTPLIITLEGDDSPVVLGVVSFIPTVGCTAQWPTVYTSTMAFLDWIQEHMVDES